MDPIGQVERLIMSTLGAGARKARACGKPVNRKGRGVVYPRRPGLQVCMTLKKEIAQLGYCSHRSEAGFQKRTISTSLKNVHCVLRSVTESDLQFLKLNGAKLDITYSVPESEEMSVPPGAGVTTLVGPNPVPSVEQLT